MIEIQIHPSDIRRRVRYLFVSRRAVIGLVTLGSIILAFVLGSMAAAPSVIRRVYKSTSVFLMRQEKAIQVERLRAHVSQMSSLEKAFDEHRLRVEKLLTVYDLETSTLGQGGLSLSRGEEQRMSELEDARKREALLKSAIHRLERQVALLGRYERENADIIRHTPAVLPLPPDDFVLTAPFGQRINPFTKGPEFHKGLDLAARTGTSIFAAADGVVTFAGRVSLSQSVPWWRMGNVVVVEHGKRFVTIYGHCDTTLVTRGQEVHQGQTIATVGSTGWSTNSHLHYEIRSDLQNPGVFRAADPRIYILNYEWSDEATLLAKARALKNVKDYDPLPRVFF
ncbi:MAG TPA: peptidoglycan DD-metalloendopeptidase family protein [Thermoanaerobaculia bacterium]|nr:peptidoglycan DD-metalloendopeptidase family protein [Thermoanaerobaculia bacterium]